MRELFYGDNLDILRDKIADESVDLCYIDPPFNSKRDYNQIYNNVAGEIDRAQARAFIDTWKWGDRAEKELKEFLDIENVNKQKITKRTYYLIKGLIEVLGKGDIMAYLVAMTIRLIEIHRVLKPTGSFYLHCDPNASHYLKLILDSIFCSQDGDFKNEIIWRRGHVSKHGSKISFPRNHDIIFLYCKNKKKQNKFYELPHRPYAEATLKLYKYDDNDGRGKYRLQELRDYGAETIEKMRQENKIVKNKNGKEKFKQYLLDKGGVRIDDVWEDINALEGNTIEALDLQTQKPEKLMERIIKTSSKEGDVVLDAFCGCGTTVAVAERLHRQWIGIDISYQQISLIRKRLEDACHNDEKWQALQNNIKIDGIPTDMVSAIALANKKDDRLRKEFEKWAILTYTNNRAIINDKKGADGGIDGEAYFYIEKATEGKAVFQVKSGKVGRKDIATFNNDRKKFGAEIGFFITLEPPTKPMFDEVQVAGKFIHPLFTDTPFNRIEIVTIEDILKDPNKRINLPMTKDVLKSAEASKKDQVELDV
ncbi:MAG: DNA methyltransferase [Alphaproteobacteria bacterium]